MSSMPMCKRIQRGSTAQVVDQLSQWFHWSGWPERLRSDAGPCFRGQFTTWCKDHGIHHDHSSAYNAASNGQAEQAVARTKKVLKRARESGQSPELALQEFRNLKMADADVSPSELFYGRRLRGELPSLKVGINRDKMVQEREMARQRYLNTGSKKARRGQFSAGDVEKCGISRNNYRNTCYRLVV